MESQRTTQESMGLNQSQNRNSKGKPNINDVVGFDFSIIGTTKSGQKYAAIIPAGTPQEQLATLFETIIPGILNEMGS